MGARDIGKIGGKTYSNMLFYMKKRIKTLIKQCLYPFGNSVCHFSHQVSYYLDISKLISSDYPISLNQFANTFLQRY